LILANSRKKFVFRKQTGVFTLADAYVLKERLLGLMTCKQHYTRYGYACKVHIRCARTPRRMRRYKLVLLHPLAHYLRADGALIEHGIGYACLATDAFQRYEKNLIFVEKKSPKMTLSESWRKKIFGKSAPNEFYFLLLARN